MQTRSTQGLLGLAAAALALPAFLFLLVIGTDGDGDGILDGDEAAAAVGGALRPDAPIPAAYVSWVIRAGSLCPEVTPAAIAAQIDLESGWNPRAYADSGEVPAKGIAQFTDPTWATWGADYDKDGQSDQWDPEDSIYAQGRLMCDLVRWTKAGVASGKLNGDVNDLAWSAYFCGRGCVEAAGGVPAAGLAHDYPQQVRSRLPKYAAADVVPTGTWTQPVPGAQIGSRFRPPDRATHDGVDLIVPRRTPIHAASSGTVLRVVCNVSAGTCDQDGSLNIRGCGWYIEILHPGNLVTRYCHMIQRPFVVVGQAVQGGQVIGLSGTSGHSSGPHLHFEVHTGQPATSSNAIDPVPFMRQAGAPLGQ